MTKGFIPTQKIETKDPETIAKDKIEEKEESIDNKLELLRYVSNVQSRIRKDISSDFILAKLSDKDKEGIIEMTANAYFVKKIMMLVANKQIKYNWNNQKQKWEKSYLEPKEKKIITEIANATFDGYMTRVYMTTILNRNVPRNYLVRLIAGYDENEDDEKPAKEELKGFEKAQQWFRDKVGLETGEW